MLENKFRRNKHRQILTLNHLLLLAVFSVSAFFIIFSTASFAAQKETANSNSKIVVPPISTDEWRAYLSDVIKTKSLTQENIIQLNTLATESIGQATTAINNGSSREESLRLVIRGYSISWYASEVARAFQTPKWEELSQSAKALHSAISTNIDSNSIDKSFANLSDVLEGSAFDIFKKKKISKRESAELTTDNAKDKRTPFEKYEGAYLGRYALCAMTQKLVFLNELAEDRGRTLDPESIRTAKDVFACIEKGLVEMKKEYNNVLRLVKKPESKKALKEHYVAAIMHVKGTHPQYKEDESTYMERMRETKRKTDELWVRFEITQ
ncbi:MAG: hypothetical protein EG822_07150 [Deltaproteobacteria bacterium]|nr:hypothetical protein [Deltaproteobacteria bacterium]TLN00413.1 MAG: hypothetical protein FDZ73_19560 [bacterium]